MRLSKKASQLIGLAVIVLFFVIAQLTARSGAKSVANNQIQPAATAQLGSSDSNQPSPTSSGSNSPFELNNFSRSSVKDGVKIWEVVAKRGTYDPEKHQAQLFESNLEVAKKDNEAMTISSDSAIIELKGTELSQATLSGNIVGHIDSKTTIYTEQAVYSLTEQQITSQTPVKIVNSMFDIDAERMVADTDQQVITLTGQVKTFIYPASEKEKRDNK